jgi:hypothetical protein
MTTRESMRRELQDLAKLAKTMPTETPPPVAAKPPRPALQRPPTPSTISVTIPPTVASVPPPLQVQAGAAGKPAKKGGRGTLVAVALVGLVVAVGGGATLGRTLARHGAPAAAAAAAVQAPVVTTNPVAVPTAAVKPAPAPQPVAAAVPAVAAQTPTPQTQSAPAHAAPPPVAVTRRVWPARPAAKSGAAPAAPVVVPSSAGTMDPLEAAIRKAVAQSK